MAMQPQITMHGTGQMYYYNSAISCIEVWDVVTEDVPELLERVKDILLVKGRKSLPLKITSTRESGSSRSCTLEIRPRIGTSYLISKTLSTGFTHGALY